jgi:hypothetical protein
MTGGGEGRAAFTQENCDALRDFLRKNWPSAEKQYVLADQCGCHPSTLNKWLNHHSKYSKPPMETYYRLVLYGYVHGWFEDDVSLPLKLSALHSAPTGSKGWKELAGDYVVYRFSYLARGMVLRGALSVDAEHYRTEERYRIQGDIMDRFTGTAGATDAVFDRSGVLSRRADGLFLMLSSKTTHPAETQVAYLEASGPYSQLRGPFTDWHSSHFYSANMWAQKLRSPMREQDIQTIEVDDIPPVIRDYLRQAPLTIVNGPSR